MINLQIGMAVAGQQIQTVEEICGWCGMRWPNKHRLEAIYKGLTEKQPPQTSQ